MRLDASRYVATNLDGDFVCLPRDTLVDAVNHNLPTSDKRLTDLEARHFVRRTGDKAALQLIAAQYRSRQALLPKLTALHLFVVTLRCDHSCQYCQVSRASDAAPGFDMSGDTADRAVDIMLESPSPDLKIEFQGGEPLLNFHVVRRIVERVRKLGQSRTVEFVVATNLALIDDEMLSFFADHRIQISTSLDGPATLHNRNRPRPGRDAYERTLAGIDRCRERLGPDSVSALLTCTAESLTRPEEIVDEYVERGFRNIFLRHISPYGFAVRSKNRIGYETEQFLEFYRRGLERIFWHNLNGRSIREVYAGILLTRILTSNPTGYVDLRSPSGLGLGCLVYNYEGDVYASDEGRMLAEMGDTSFRLGNVRNSTWRSLIVDSELLETVSSTMTEGLPGCCDCAFQPYCGSDPVFHYTTQGDRVGHRPTSAFCRRNMEVIRHLILLLEDRPEIAGILNRWAL